MATNATRAEMQRKVLIQVILSHLQSAQLNLDTHWKTSGLSVTAATYISQEIGLLMKTVSFLNMEKNGSLHSKKETKKRKGKSTI